MKTTYQSGRVHICDRSMEEVAQAMHLAGEFLAKKHRRLRDDLAAIRSRWRSAGYGVVLGLVLLGIWRLLPS